MTSGEAAQAVAAPRRIRFEPIITMGNLLSIVAMAGAVVTVWTGLQIQLATQEQRIAQIEDQLDDLKSISAAVVQIRVDIATIRALYQAQLTGKEPDPPHPG